MKIIVSISLIFTIVVLFSCYKEKDYNKPVDPNLYQITTDKGSIQGDGFSTATLTVEIPWDADDSSSTILFKTTAGAFVEGGTKSLSVKAKRSVDKHVKVAKAVLRSSMIVETASITVELFDIKRNIEIKFTNSYPEKLKISSSSLAIKPLNTSAGEVNIDGLISKLEGFPSVGNIVDVIAWDSVFIKQLGSFRIYNNQSNDLGKTNYVFVLGDSVANNLPGAYLGKLYLIAKSLKNDQTQYINDTIKLISSR